MHTLTELNLISNNIRSTSIDNYLVDQSSMARLPKNIVLVDPERQPHIKKFVTDGRRVGISTVSGKINNKAVPKKRRRRSTGETKGKSEKRHTLIHSESSFVSEEGAESLTSKMAATTINPVSPSVTMLQEFKNMEERLKASMKENREKHDMEGTFH